MKSHRISPAPKSLAALAPNLLFGTLSATFRTCGKPDCVCHSGQRHGPYLHVSYREAGRTRGYYVPAALEQQVREGIEAWQRFQSIALDLAEQNRIRLGLGSGRNRKAKGRTR